MLVSLITERIYQTMPLPEQTTGIFRLRDAEGSVLFELFGTPDGWQVRETRNGRLSAGQEDVLRRGTMLSVRLYDRERAYLYADIAGRRYAKFARCIVPDSISYTVGSGRDNNLICSNPYIAEHHCVLACRQRIWTVRDCRSATGTYVNGSRIGQSAVTLKNGDTVSVLNQKFIVLPGLLCFNAQYLDTASLKGHFQPISVPRLAALQPLRPEQPVTYFRRKPRFTDAVEEKDFTVKAPPSSNASGPEGTPTVLSVGPALMSGATMLLSGMNPLASVGMLASSVLFPKLSRNHSEKQHREAVEQQQKLYQEYLTKLESELNELYEKQTAMLRSQLPEPSLRLQKLMQNSSDLWSHRPEHQDFLHLRLGTGDIPVKASVKFPDGDLKQLDEPIRQQLQAFQDKPRLLRQVPILLELGKFHSVGISGSPRQREALAAQLLGQACSDIGYDDMKVCLIGPLSDQLSCLTWLPHTWDNSRTVHLLAKDASQLDALAQILSGLMGGNDGRYSGNGEAKRPRLLVLITDPSLAQTGLLTRLLFDNPAEGLHMITLAEHASQLPSRTDVAIGLKENRGRMVWQAEGHRETLDFRPDHNLSQVLPQIVSLMANTQLDLKQNAFTLPSTVPFLDLFGTQDVQRLDLPLRWAKADPTRSLAAPLGISEDGSMTILDLSEKADGPHGLIAGTTGSGKSELIMTYILSMAVSFSPEEVNFLLIDYKGGGMAQAFRELPHTAGVITNLDGDEIQRSLMSIRSELNRRQRVFSDVMSSLGLTKLEIGDYQRCYREKRVSEAMPRLIIIADEFAELKTQEPEFMNELISVARIGRSLGVHLILATQQPAGVVNDQIWGNANFKICLRVQSEQDSKQVLKQPDAVSLKRPGEYYKQVGARMIRGQSAWVGADYTPGKRTVPAFRVEVLDSFGSVLGSSSLTNKPMGDTVSQASAVTRHIIETARQQGLSARLLWQSKLSPVIPLEDLYDRYQPSVSPWILDGVVGELDDPAGQARALVRLPLSEGRNTIVYGGLGSGKYMLLQTVLTDLISHHTPDELQIYALDYADDGLSRLQGAPHVGDVLSANETEKLNRLMAMLEKEISLRKKLMGGAGGAQTMSERLQQAGLPWLLIVLHRLEKLKLILENSLSRLINLLKEGQSWGLTFLATQDSASGLGFQLEGCFTQQFVLQMGRDDEYSVLLGRIGNMRPASVKGRGLLRNDDTYYEFQTATAAQDTAGLCRRLAAEWIGPCAQSIRTMPEVVNAALLAPLADPAHPFRLPVGLNPKLIDPVFYDFDERVIHLLLGRRKDLGRFLRSLAVLAVRQGLQLLALDHVGLLVGQEGVESADVDGVALALERLDAQSALLTQPGNEDEEDPPQLIILPAVQSLMSILDSTHKGMLRRLLLRPKREWNWRILVCDSPQNFKSLMYDREDKLWLETSVSAYDGIYLGGGIRGNGVLSTEGYNRELQTELAFPMGYVVRDEIPELVRFLSEQ